MDLLKLIRSFGDLLFEVLSWIIYLPLTLWRVVRDPLRMIDYSAHELTEGENERYTDTLSPPLLLLLTLAVLHGLELATHSPTIAGDTATARLIAASDQNLLLARAFLFGLLPLFAAWRYVMARGLPPERKHLRPPFYGQCYLATIYALAISLAVMLGRLDVAAATAAGWLAAAAATIWYLTVQTLQFRRSLDTGTPRALLLALRAYAEAVGVFLLAIAVIAFGA